MINEEEKGYFGFVYLDNKKAESRKNYPCSQLF